MPRIVPLASAALLTSCSTAPAQPPAHGETPGHECQPAGLEQFAGRPATSEVGAEILRVSKAAVLRWLRPGQIVTMEYRADRVSVALGAGNRIERVNCG